MKAYANLPLMFTSSRTRAIKRIGPHNIDILSIIIGSLLQNMVLNISYVTLYSECLDCKVIVIHFELLVKSLYLRYFITFFIILYLNY